MSNMSSGCKSITRHISFTLGIIIFIKYIEPSYLSNLAEESDFIMFVVTVNCS